MIVKKFQTTSTLSYKAEEGEGQQQGLESGVKKGILML